jgi:hypothetical protein
LEIASESSGPLMAHMSATFSSSYLSIDSLSFYITLTHFSFSHDTNAD